MAKKILNAKKKKTAAELRQTAFIRFMIVIAVFVVWFGGVGARLVYLQITQHEPLKEKAASGEMFEKAACPAARSMTAMAGHLRSVFR